MAKSDVKLYVCCHQPFHVPKHPMLVPIQVGSALAAEHFEGFQHDDTGENISDKNRSYCELTAQYWAWKNADCDYYGLFHYRRYLYPNINEKLPYRILAAPSDETLAALEFDRLKDMILQHDLIIPKGENMYISVRDHYADAPHHHGKDLKLIETILDEKHPEMSQAVEEYLSGSVCYFGNICIMSKVLFDGYCSWLFPVLEEFDRRADLTGYTPQELRVDGYLAERLLGIYVVWLRQQEKGLRVLELPRAHFEADDSVRRKKLLLNWILPPGSRWRSYIKRLKRR